MKLEDSFNYIFYDLLDLIDNTTIKYRHEAFPDSRTNNLNKFTIGSARNEVIAIQGTPTSIRKYLGTEILSYGLSTVTIETGVVTEYSNFDRNLKIK